MDNDFLISELYGLFNQLCAILIDKEILTQEEVNDMFNVEGGEEE